jgi:hypothetical protein
LKDTAATVWDAISGAVKTAWNSFLSPIFNSVKDFVMNTLVPIFNKLWDVVKVVWDSISGAIGWVWNNVISPIFNGIKSAIEQNVIPVWNTLKDAISTVWSAITGIVSGAWNTISDIMASVWNSVASAIESVVNGLIRAYNNLPGPLKIWEIEEIHMGRIKSADERRTQDYKNMWGFASGGQMYGTGASGQFNSPTYLVGEGGKGYPEFVIPTDPSYRGRAQELLASAAAAIGSKAGAASVAASRSSYMMPSTGSSSGSASYGGGDTYITVDTFVGEEEWFASLAKKYNMKAVPRERKVAGQQRRVISSYNNRWDVK